jgi:sigma-B regulation protein RsbU (phosphoserine phosphatase)
MDGLTLLENLKGLDRPDLKTIIVSAYGDMVNIRTAMNRGAFDFVMKPIDFKDLEMTIQNTLEEIQRIQRSQEIEQQLSSLRYDLDIASRIQQNILPQEFPPYPDDYRFKIFGKMLAAKHVGGDFYDFFKIDDDELAFFIGDVSGKGIPAAIYMAVCRTMLKSIGSEVADPAECLQKVNQMLIPESDISTFVTVFYGILNAKTGELRYSNGGHNLPYLLSAEGEVRLFEDVGGLILGKFDSAEFDKETLQLNPGDSIITYTDGVTEAVNTEEEFFDEKRLEDYLKYVYSKSIDNRLKGLFVEVLKFTGAAPQADDITALTVQYNGKS